MNSLSKKYITPPADCTGCGLCANVCSQDAIRMAWNADGFLVPHVDTEKCINCGLCVKKCIVNAPKPDYHDNIEQVKDSYGAWNKATDILSKSSSGGIFTALAEHTLQNGGVVYGVIWKNNKTAAFSRASSPEELATMRGSKYTQAIPEYVYRNVKDDLKSGCQVLFSGTGCQVMALKQFLGKDYDNLLTIDVLCHGAPSHIILDKYVEESEKKYGKSIQYVSFRDKRKGWRDFHVVRHFDDGSEKACTQRKDVYMRLFLSELALNQACYNCISGHLPKPGDITLGDYWGVHKLQPEWPIKEGVSAVLANTEKGKQALTAITNAIELHSQPFENIYRGQGIYIRPAKELPSERDSFINTLRNHPLKVAYGKLTYAFEWGPLKIRYRNFLYRAYIGVKKWFR